jgi:hypothetical protein
MNQRHERRGDLGSEDSRSDDARAACAEQRLAEPNRRDVTQRTARGAEAPAPRRPDERDESADSQASPPRAVVKRAHDDLADGRVDTDQRSRGATELMQRLRADESSARNTRSEESTEDGP